MKVLVTGGAGFIGSHTVDLLVEEGHTVRVLDSLDPAVHPEGAWPAYLRDDVERVTGDIRDPDTVRAALDGVEGLVHLAAALGVGRSMYEVRRYVDVNSLGAAVLLDVLSGGSHDVERMVVASSMSCYGEGAYDCPECGAVHPPLRTEEQLARREWELRCTCGRVLEPRPTPETKALEPTSVYAVTKRDQEELFLVVGGAYGIPTAALRLFNVYGPRQALSNPYTGVLAIFASRMLNGAEPLVFEDGGQSRDFIHVRDVARALVTALETPAVTGVYNVGTGRATSVLELGERLAAQLEYDGGFRVENRFRTGDIRHAFADVTRIREALGFRAEIGLDEGLRDTTAWIRATSADDRVDEAARVLEERGLIR